MKVYIITKEPFPNGMAATNRIKCYAKAIAEQGIKCEILNFTRTEVYGKTPKNTVGIGNYEGIPFRYIGRTPLRASNVFLRQIYDQLDKWELIRYLKMNLRQGDTILSYFEHDIKFTLRLINLAHKYQTAFVRDLCEIPYGTGTENLKALKNRQETYQRIFPLLDGIIAISDALVELAKIRVSPNCKILKVPILVDFEKYNIEDLSNEAEYPYIFHSGTLYEQKDGILGMIEAFGIAKQKSDKDFHFVLTGSIDNSPHAVEIRELISKYEIEKYIHFTGYLSDDELRDYLAKASLVIINKYRTQQNQYCFSTKLGEYLAAGKPVIITNVGEAMNWLKDNDSAYIVEFGNVDSLSNAIIKAYNDDIARKDIAYNGKKMCKKSFDYRMWGKVIVKMLFECRYI